MSTVWYLGSDESFHYFTHFIKASTNYRIRRSDMSLVEEDEFELGAMEEVLADHLIERAEWVRERN